MLTYSEPNAILEENHHPFLIVEHNPQLYERARDMAGCIAEATKQASREATILLYASALDRHLEAMAENADRVFCFYDMQGAGVRQSRSMSRRLQARPPGRLSHDGNLVA
jgi:hypothetical protein